jgi:FAD binding domain-containing protein
MTSVTSTLESQCQLPNLNTLAEIPLDNQKVLYPNTKLYNEQNYQYGTTSHTHGTMSPAAIVIPIDKSDIQITIKYARENNIAIAVKTGGHQYSGASSTSGQNIQLDLSQTFQELDYNQEHNLLRVGISFPLFKLNQELRKRNLFLPHGQCGSVHLGGHILSGGYGQNTRAHGILADHVLTLEIISSDGSIQTLHRADNTTNQGLFWAMLGGSPGSFGVLTHVTFKPLHDEDYPHSRGMKIDSFYSKEKLEKIITILTQMSDNDNFPRDFDMSITVLGDAKNSWYFSHGLDKKLKYKENLTTDEEMLLNHAKKYGDGIDSAEKGILTIPIHSAIMTIWLQWANTKGSKQIFGEKENAFFQDVKNAVFPNYLDYIVRAEVKLSQLFNHKTQNFRYLDYEEHTPMSMMSAYWMFDDVREYVMPYEKRGYLSTAPNLSENGFVEWIGSRVETLLNPKESRYKGLKPVLQLQPFGGRHSMIQKYNDDTTSHSFRATMTVFMALDCFYEVGGNSNPNNLQYALDWVAENDLQAGDGGKFSTKDIRMLAFSYTRVTDINGHSLDAQWEKYFDSRDKYDRLMSIKSKTDPNGIFTPNTFGICAWNASIILGLGH